MQTFQVFARFEKEVMSYQLFSNRFFSVLGGSCAFKQTSEPISTL